MTEHMEMLSVHPLSDQFAENQPRLHIVAEAVNIPPGQEEEQPADLLELLRAEDMPYVIARVLALRYSADDTKPLNDRTISREVGVSVADVSRYTETGQSLLGSMGINTDEISKAGLAAVLRSRHPEHAVSESASPAAIAPVPSRSPADTRQARAHVNVSDLVTIRHASNRREEGSSSLDVTRLYMNQISKVDLLTAEQEVELAKRIEAGVFAQERLDSQTPGKSSLADQDRGDLQRIAAEGKAAYQHFYQANLRLVVGIAKRYMGSGLDLLDLVQEGNDGLDKAVQMFDYTKGYKFSTYATHWIRQSVHRGIANTCRNIRLPVHAHEDVVALKVARGRLMQKTDAEPTLAQLAAELSFKEAKVANLLEIMRDTISLDKPMCEDGGESTLGDVLGGESAEDSAMRTLVFEPLHQALGSLPPRMADIIRRTHGVDAQGGWSPEETQSIEEVAQKYSIVPAHARRLLHEGLMRLRSTPGLNEL